MAKTSAFFLITGIREIVLENKPSQFSLVIVLDTCFLSSAKLACPH
ncbi:hypothetical protein JCM17843_31650 [Kordiimonadales bacterium JCM 17843]|nr:hypothetical protein JCM17843_31650 [Kordiimonadales bacterium JCM 17843]